MQVKESVSSIVFDKTTLFGLSGIPGTGLSMNKRGVMAVQQGADASSASLVSPASLGNMTPTQRQELRDYAVLLHVLSGEPVDMDRLRSDAWELEAMTEQLNPLHGKSAKEQRAVRCSPQCGVRACTRMHARALCG
ncbi:hypothetical protein EON67_08010, partial [archaeon]